MNVLVIISDTFRRDHLGCYGNDWIRTPHIDRFAADALIFDRAYIASFPTVPARLDLFTGRFSSTYSAWAPLEKEEVVAAECFNRMGFTTTMVTDTAQFLKDGYNYDRGFQAWEWIRGQEFDRWRTDPEDPELPADPAKIRWAKPFARSYMRNVADRRFEEDYFCPRTMIEAGRRLERNYGSERPFFLYVDTFDPHEPWDAPQWYVDMYDPGYEGDRVIYPHYAESSYLTEAELKHVRAMYAAEVTMVDRWVGHLLGRLQDTGRLEETIVVFGSDHGFLHGEHGYIGKSLVGRRFTWLPLWEEVCHVPLIVRVPGGRRGRTDALVQLPDLLPTLLDLIGGEIPDRVQGESFAAVLRGETDIHREMALSLPTLIHGGAARATITATTQEWSYICSGEPLDARAQAYSWAVDGIRKPIDTEEVGGDELYHLRSDPGQQDNLIGKHPDVACDLRASIQSRLRELGTAPELVGCWDPPASP